MPRITEFSSSDKTYIEKLCQLNWQILLMIFLIAGVGFSMLYSAANGDLSPWASRQMLRFGIGVVLMLVISIIDIRFWLKMSYMFYGISFILLATVDVLGSVAMGAQRWLDLTLFQLQPSEIMKIVMVMALARYFHGLEVGDVGKLRYLVIPVLLIVAPIALVLRQPDLGTAGVLGLIGAVLLWLAGVRVWQCLIFSFSSVAAIPLGWQFLHEYQKQRVLTFINPELDP